MFKENVASKDRKFADDGRMDEAKVFPFLFKYEQTRNTRRKNHIYVKIIFQWTIMSIYLISV